MELHLVYENAARAIEKHGVKIARSLVGDYVTSLKMAGCSITVTLVDENLLDLWDAPVNTAGLR